MARDCENHQHVEISGHRLIHPGKQSKMSREITTHIFKLR